MNSDGCLFNYNHICCIGKLLIIHALCIPCEIRVYPLIIKRDVSEFSDSQVSCKQIALNS